MEYFLVNPIKKWSCSGTCKYYQRRNEEIKITLSRIKNDLKHITNNNFSNDIHKKRKAEYILINWKVCNSILSEWCGCFIDILLDNPVLRSTDSGEGIGYVSSLNCQKKY